MPMLLLKRYFIMRFGRIQALTLSGVASAFLAITPALADDVRPSGQDWQGFYVGAALGGASSAAEPDIQAIHNGYFNTVGGVRDDEQLNPILQKKIDGLDVTGSVLAGYDFQSGNITYGLEGDLTFMAFSQTESFGPAVYLTAPPSAFTTQTTVESDFQLSLRPTLGYVTGLFRFHVSAGPSISRFKTTHQYSDNHAGGSSVTFSDTKTALGVSSSVGVGYMMPEGWALRSDYVFSYYPSIADGSSELNGDGRTDFTYDADFRSHNLRLALIKRF